MLRQTAKATRNDEVDRRPEGSRAPRLCNQAATRLIGQIDQEASRGVWKWSICVVFFLRTFEFRSTYHVAVDKH